MALISSAGGQLKTSAPRGLFGRAGAGIGRTTRAAAKPIHMAAIRPPHVPAVHTPAPAGAAGAGHAAGADPNDPFAFIKGLLASTDPTAIRGLIDPIYAPIRQEYQNQISQLDATGTARANQMSQIYQAFEQYLGGMPAQIQSIYGQKGAADGAALTGMAGPQGDVGSHLAAMSNSGLMDALGKNWASYAAAQPHIYALYATQNIKQMLNATQDSEAQLRAKLLDLSSKEASDILSYLENAQSKDASLQELAFQQKQAQTNAKASQSQAYLNYLQKQRQINFNNAIVSQKLTLAEARAQSDANYKASLLQLKQAGLIDTAQYHQAMIGLGQQRVNIAQTNATNRQRNADRTYALAQKRYALSEKKYQQARMSSTAKVRDKLTAAQGAASAYAKTLWAQQSTLSSTSVTKKKGVTVHTTQKAGTYTMKQIYNRVYGRYAAELKLYYKQINPTYSNAQIGGLVNRVIRAAVGSASG